jgi:hypothetical protein
VRIVPSSWWRAGSPRSRDSSYRVRRWSLAALALLLALAGETHAITARVRWLPGAGGTVVGYDVFVRAAGQPYGAAIDAGLPSAGSGGALAYDVGNLADGVTYYFSVKARAVDGTRSACPGELVLGTTDGCLADRCCPGESCTFGAALDGTPCDDGDACRLCHAGACATPTESALETVRLRVTSRSAAPRVTATGSFAAVAAVDPTAEGLTLSLFDGAGSVVASVYVPAEAMRANRARTSFVLARDRRGGALKMLAIRIRNGQAKVRARLESDPGTLTGPLGWAMATGDSCGRSPALSCTATASGLNCG